MSDIESEETLNFREDAKFNALIAFLKSCQSDQEAEANRAKLIVAISFVVRRVSILSGDMFKLILSGYSFEPSCLDSVSDAIYEWFKSNKVGDNFFDNSWFKEALLDH